MTRVEVLRSSSMFLLVLQLLRALLVHSQTHGDIRLAGYGASSAAGRLEVYYIGEWGTVCWDEFFDLISASVACRQLGLGPAVHVVHYPELRYDVGSGPIHLKSVRCQGAESHILRCQHSNVTNSCQHYLDTGIVCSLNFFPYPGQVRLFPMASTSIYSSTGLLQMHWEGQWMGVHSNGLTDKDASSVCQQLGFTGMENTEEMDFTDLGSWVEMSTTDSNCPTSSEPCFTTCFTPSLYSNSTGKGMLVSCVFESNMVESYPAGNSTCQVTTPTNQLDVKMTSVVDECDDPPCNYYQGVPKVFLEGEWRRVCDGSLANGEVICRQLGFSIAVRYPVSSDFGPGIELECNGMETQLSECPPPSLHGSCDQVNLRCGNGDVPYGSLKLINSSGSSGALLVYNQTFLPICDDGFSMKEAMVVCRQFGYAGVLEVIPNSLFVADDDSMGDGFFSSVSCTGNEDYLLDCQHTPVDPSVCRLPYDTVGVQCRTNDYQMGKITIKVGNGEDGVMSGRLQVNIDGTWGSVCGVEFDDLDAHVACRELGYATAVQFMHDPVPIMSLPVAISTLGCSGFEESLFSCPHTVATNDSSCNHDNDVFIECATDLPQQDFELRLLNQSNSSSTSSVSGRLEITVHGLWMTVCGTFFTQNEADVACRGLGYSRSSSFCTNACYGNGSGYIFFSDSCCTGNEDTLAVCFNEDEDVHNDEFCSHGSDVGLSCVMDDPTTSPTQKPSSSIPVTTSILNTTPFYDPLSPITFYLIVGAAGLLVVMVCIVLVIICCCYCCFGKKSKKKSIAISNLERNANRVEQTHVNCISPLVSSEATSFADIRQSPSCKKKEAELNSHWAIHRNGGGTTPDPQQATLPSGVSGNAPRPASSIIEKDNLDVNSPTAVSVPVCLEIGCHRPQSRDSLPHVLPPSYDELEFNSYPTISRTGNQTSD